MPFYPNTSLPWRRCPSIPDVLEASERTSGNLSNGSEMDERSPYWQKRARCPKPVIIAFYRELSTLLKAGISIIDALQVTVEHSANDTMALVAADLQAKLDSGYTLSAAMGAFPKIFDPIAIALIRLGENSGQIIQQLGQIALWMDRDDKLRRKVISALTYPTFALTVTGVLTMALFLTVIPGFMEMFEEMKVDLPFPTRVLAVITNVATSPLVWAGAGFSALVLTLLSKNFFKSAANRLLLYQFALTVPVIGSLLQYTAIARFSFSATAMLNSGGNVVTGFRLSAAASGSPAMIADADRMACALEEGRLLSEHMGEHPEIYPRIAVQLAGVGEESARMPEMFQVMAKHFEELIEHQIHLVTTLLEPALMSVVSFVVGFVVVAVFLPMYGFISKI